MYQRDDINYGDIYTAVTPNVIFKIIDHNQVLWKAKDSNYPYKVFIGDEVNNERHIQVYFPSVSSEDHDYTPPTQPEFQFTLLEMDIKVKKTDQYVIYKKDVMNEREKFTCKPGYLIYKVYSGLKLVTTAANHKYFDRVVIYKDEFGNKNLQGLVPGQIDEGDPDEPLPVFTPPDADFTLLQSEVLDHQNHLLYVNLKNKISTRFVTYEADVANNVDIFTAKEPYRFALVMNGNSRAWKYKNGDHPNQVFVFMDEKGSPFLRLGFPRVVSRFPKPTLITLDVRNSESNHEFSYEYDASAETKIFRPKPGFLIDKVMKGTTLMWKCENFIYPEKVMIIPDENGERALRLEFPRQEGRERSAFMTNVERQVSYEPLSTIPPVKHASSRESLVSIQESECKPQFEPRPLISPIKKSSVGERQEQLEDIELDHKLEPQHVIDAHKDFSPSVRNRLPEIGIESVMESVISPIPKGSMRLPGSETETSEHTRFIRSKRQVRLPHSEPELVFKSDRSFEPEPRISVETPEHKPKFKPAQFTISGSRTRQSDHEHEEEKVTVVPTKYKSGKYIYKKDPTRLILDFTRRTDVFKYDTYVANHTYTATVAHLFDKVGIYDPYVKNIPYIWEAAGSHEYAYKVEQFGYHHVLIYMNNGTFALFSRDDDDKWTHQEFSKEEESEIDVRKPEHEVVTFDVEGKVSSTVLFNKLIHVDIAHKWNTFMSGYTKKGNLYTFKPGEGFIISAVMDSSVSTYLGQAVPIWDTGDPRKFCESVEHDVTEDILTLYCLDGSRKLFKKINKKWINFMFNHSVDNTKKLPIVLNLSTQNRFVIYEFESDVDNKSMTCTVKEGYAIKEVLWLQSDYQWYRFDKNVWSTEDPLYFARKVYVKNLGFGEKVINIDLFNGLRLTFHRSLWGVKWDFMGSKVIREQ
ncbi:hypothetical protein MACK_002554 [Theileria orientalis]|uniref:Uncharacterized protein n=1 Tax=Theileria orientalis TaxID=68886 RepID=A0A976QXD9_THEOR|nr:hypothetical protein MACK_002554 [Theileria orientalis]